MARGPVVAWGDDGGDARGFFANGTRAGTAVFDAGRGTWRIAAVELEGLTPLLGREFETQTELGIEAATALGGPTERS